MGSHPSLVATAEVGGVLGGDRIPVWKTEHEWAHTHTDPLTHPPKHKQVRQYKQKKLVPFIYLLKGLNISGKINTDAKLDSDKWLKSAHLPTKRFR